MTALMAAAMLLATMLLATMSPCAAAETAAVSAEWIVGTDVAFDDITDFYYTYASSTFPPDYQRYRVYVEDGARFFYHETRAGERFPLEEADVTASGTVALTDGDWARFCALLAGGAVRPREENLDCGDAGPWLYLYWNGDGGTVQQFSFASWDALAEFEAFCESLRER